MNRNSVLTAIHAPRSIPHQFAYRGDQVFELEGLHERLHSAGLARDLEHVVIPQRLVAGHGDDLHLGKLPAQVAYRLDALLFRHEDVGDDHVGRPRALQRQSLNAVSGAFGFDAAALEPPQRKLPEVVAVVDDENARHVLGKGRRNADSMQSARDNPHKRATAAYGPALAPRSPASARVPRQVPRALSAQASVNVAQAMLSQAMLAQAMLSQAMLSQATLSQATLAQAGPCQIKISQAMPGR